MIILESLIKLIAQLCSEKYYGQVIIEFKEGKIVQIDKTERFIELK